MSTIWCNGIKKSTNTSYSYDFCDSLTNCFAVNFKLKRWSSIARKHVGKFNFFYEECNIFYFLLWKIPSHRRTSVITCSVVKMKKDFEKRETQDWAPWKRSAPHTQGFIYPPQAESLRVWAYLYIMFFGTAFVFILISSRLAKDHIFDIGRSCFESFYRQKKAILLICIKKNIWMCEHEGEKSHWTDLWSAYGGMC